MKRILVIIIGCCINFTVFSQDTISTKTNELIPAKIIKKSRYADGYNVTYEAVYTILWQNGDISVIKTSNETSFDFLKGQKEINVILDYSDLKIDEKPENVYLVYRGNEWATKWEAAKTEFYQKFITASTFNSEQIVFGNIPNAEYTVIVKILSLDWDMDAIVFFIRTNDTKILAAIDLHGNSAIFGSAETKTSSAMINAGEKFGKFVSKKIRKSKLR